MRRAPLILLILALYGLLLPQIQISICTDSGVFGNPNPASPDWAPFWALFNSVSAWDLEADTGSGWFSCKEDLTIQKTYREEYICKIRLLFNSSHHADYRLTFLINRRVQNYIYLENRTRYEISYQNYTVFFSWEDLLAIPGLLFSHGITDYEGKPCFWFRIRRNNVPQGISLDLDPSFGATGGTYLSSWGGGNDLIGCIFTSPDEQIIVPTEMGALCKWDGGYAKIKFSIYKHSDLSFIVGSEEAIVSSTVSIVTAEVNQTVFLEPLTEYLLCIWFGNESSGVYSVRYDSGSTNQTARDIENYGEYPSSFIKDNVYDQQTGIWCEYTTDFPPSIGEFQSSEDPVYGNTWFNVNATINHEGGISHLKNSTLELSEGIILAWVNGTGFSESQDFYDYCTLNSTASIEDVKNSTAIILSWRIRLSNTFPHGSSVNVVADNTLVYDSQGNSGSGYLGGLFVFEPEEHGEPVGIGGGGTRRTPLEEMGVATPLPYEVAPPEAQYGTIGITVILAGAVLYYLSKKRATGILGKEKIPSRRNTRSSTKPNTRKIHSKKQIKRGVKRKK